MTLDEKITAYHRKDSTTMAPREYASLIGYALVSTGAILQLSSAMNAAASPVRPYLDKMPTYLELVLQHLR